MVKRYFTFDEVNELIPQLEHHFHKLLLHKKEMGQTSLRLRKMGITPQLIGRVPNDAPRQVQDLQIAVRRSYREFKQHLFSIENMGGEIKDLELGRVDFPATEEGGDIILTWQLGVTEVAYPHPVGKELGFEEDVSEPASEIEPTTDLYNS